MRVCPLPFLCRQRKRNREGGRDTWKQGRLAGRLIVNLASWLAEPLLCWLPFCWLVGGLAPDCTIAWSISIFLCFLPACPPSLASRAELHVCPATSLGFAMASSLPPYASAVPHPVDV